MARFSANSGSQSQSSRSSFNQRTKDADRDRRKKEKSASCKSTKARQEASQNAKVFNALASRNTLWVGNIPAGTSERDLQAHFKQHLGATAELEMRCVRGVPLKDPKAIPNGAIKIKNTRYATLTFSGRDPHATALKGVDDMNGKKLQFEFDAMKLREVRRVVNGTEAKMERMRETSMSRTSRVDPSSPKRGLPWVGQVFGVI